MKEKWFEKSYRRIETIFQISDRNEKFLSEFDPRKYVELLITANADATLFFVSAHGGECFWPTKIGHMHRSLKGRDLLGEVLDLYHQRGISVMIYYSVIFNNWAYETHPDWRIVDVAGKSLIGPFFHGRCGVCCPNSPYRDFVVAQLEELCENYEFEGIWADMTFWPAICYCHYCRQRYASEVGRRPPTVVNWRDPHWIEFQRKREEWLADFAALVTSTVKRLKPKVSIAHNGVAFAHDWMKLGASLELAKQSDYMTHDFYGDSLEQSFYCKLFSSLGENPRFEYVICRNHRREHTTTKSKELLKAHAYSTLANNGAFRIYDDPDPTGIFNREVYKLIGSIFREMETYEKYLGGRSCQDVGIYINFESGIDLTDDDGVRFTGAGPEVYEKEWQNPPVSALSTAKSLLNAHIPFGVITKKNLAELNSYQIIILPNLGMIDEEEAQALKEFVASGGSLYASKYTSLLRKDGKGTGNFLLSDLFGVTYLGETNEVLTYVSPREERKDLFPFFSSEYPLAVPDTQIMVKAEGETEVLATVTLPYVDPKSTSYYSQIHSNPPGIYTAYPSVVLHKYGRGKVIYAAGVLEGLKFEIQRRVFINLVKLLCVKPFFFELDAPKSVEVTLFHQEDKKRYLVNLLNFQSELPNFPIEGIKLRIRVDGEEPKRLVKLPEEAELSYKSEDGYIECTVPKLETFLMLALDCR